MSNQEFSELQQQQLNQLQRRQKQEIIQLLSSQQQTWELYQHLAELLKQQHMLQLQEFLQQQTCPLPQQTKKDEIGQRKNSLRACDFCRTVRLGCVMEEGAAFCNRCIDKEKTECTFNRVPQKRGRKSGNKNQQKVKTYLFFFKNFSLFQILICFL